MSRAEGVPLADIQCPTGKVEEGEKVIGTLPDDLKRLYTVMRIAENERGELKHRISKLGSLLDLDERQTNDATRALGVIRNRFDLAHSCFWHSVRHTFPEIVNTEQIGLRENWQLVTIPDRQIRCVAIPIPASILPD